MSKCGKIHWNERMGAMANARRQLPALMTGYYAEVRRVLATDPLPPELHAIRLASKKVRYTLELFAPCYGPGLEQRLETMKRLQTVLGEVNDSVATEALVTKAAPATPTRERIESFLRHRAQTKAAEVRKEWTEVFDAPGREAWWVRYLAQNARPEKREKKS